jgi:hypothetical protein
VSIPVDEEAFHLEDLEEFRHAIDSEYPIDGDLTSLHGQSFVEGFSSFLQHQPAAQSTPSWPAPQTGQSFPPEEAELPSLIKDRLSIPDGDESILSDPSVSFDYDLQMQQADSEPRNRSAFSVPSGWTRSEDISSHNSGRDPHSYSTWPHDSTSLVGSRPSHMSMGNRESRTREFSHSEVASNLLHSTADFSFPLAQRPRDAIDSTTSSHDLSGLRPAPSWSVQEYLTSLYPENQYQLSPHTTTDAQMQLPDTPAILDGLEPPSHHLADPPANSPEKSVSELLDPRSLSISSSNQQLS